jgi:hypothetical protein
MNQRRKILKWKYLKKRRYQSRKRTSKEGSRYLFIGQLINILQCNVQEIKSGVGMASL